MQVFIKLKIVYLYTYSLLHFNILGTSLLIICQGSFALVSFGLRGKKICLDLYKKIYKYHSFSYDLFISNSVGFWGFGVMYPKDLWQPA